MITVFGYISMLIAIISMLMSDLKKLRIINTIACAMFVIYGLFLSAYPIVVMNIIVIGINLKQLKEGK